MVGESADVLVLREARDRGWISRPHFEECVGGPASPVAFALSRRLLTDRQIEELRRDISRRQDATAPSSAGPGPSPKRLGKYRLDAELGRGGMGSVHKAWDPELRRWVALKVLHHLEGPEEILRFRREAQTAATLSHPGIVAVYEIGQEADTPYIAMEFVDGTTLSGRKFPIRTACQVMVAVARAVDHAHRRGIIHRDLKPQNIMLDRTKAVRVMDFGLAKPLRERTRLTVTGTVVGTPSYMPPEQADGQVSQVDHRSDVYSLGAVLYELLTHRPPFEGASVLETLSHVVEREVPRPSRFNRELPRDLEAVVLRALEKEKARRYPSAEAFARDLERFLEGAPVDARRPTLARRLWRHLRRHPAAWAATGGGAVASALLTLLLLRKTPDLPEPPPRVIAKPPLPAPRPAKPSPRDLAQPELDAGSKRLELERLDLYRPGADLSRMRKALDEAALHFTKALDIFPSHEAALLGRAQTRILQGRPGEALRDLGRAIEILPAFPAARIARGQILMEKVLSYLDTSAWRREELPPDVSAWKTQALEDFRKARESGLQGNDLEYTEAALAVAEERPEPAIALLTRIIDSGGAREETYLLRGDAWQMKGAAAAPGPLRAQAVDAAIRDFTEAIHLRANYHEALRHRAALNYVTGHPDRCLEDLEAGLRIDPDDSSALFDLATYHQRTGNPEKAFAFFARALEMDPGNFRALNNRASLKMERKDYAGARSDLERALRISPDHVASRINLACCRDLLGETNEGIRIVNEILDRQPKYARGYYTRGMLRTHLADWGAALQDLEQAASLDPQEFGAPLRATREEVRRRAGLR
jgi:serine/threonine protein kinase/Tfp pilus assembly protein PilF